jgi:hypothetical protein
MRVGRTMIPQTRTGQGKMAVVPVLLRTVKKTQEDAAVYV